MISPPHKLRVKNFILTLLFMCCLFAMAVVTVEAGTWRVSPIKLHLDAKTRSDVVTVSNDSDQALSLEITAMEWSQNQEGEDIYLPATDLVFFPKQLSVEPKKERVVRVGIKTPATKKEKIYRLFIKEIPNKKSGASNTVAIAIRFGVPIFVKPAIAEIKGVISETIIMGGKASIKIKNQGNSHFRIKSVDLEGLSADGKVLYSENLDGWYVLSGSSRNFATTIPTEICKQLNVMDIQIDATPLKLGKKVDIDKAMCVTQ